jgi:hypothetical protein
METTTTSDPALIRLNTLRRLAHDSGLFATSELTPEESAAFHITGELAGAKLQFNLGHLIAFLDFNDELAAAYAALGLLEEFDAESYEDRCNKQLMARHGRHWDVSDKALLERQELNGLAGLAYAYPIAMRLYALTNAIEEPTATLEELRKLAQTTRRAAYASR